MTTGTSRSFLVVVHPYPPTPSSGAHRWAAMVKYLRRAGHDVRVVTSGAFGTLANPADERSVIRTADLMASARLRAMAGLAPLAVADGTGAKLRTEAAPVLDQGADPALSPLLTKVLVPDAFLLSWAPMALAAAWRALRRRPVDCVVTSSPNDSTHLVGLLLKRAFGHVWIADLRDGWTFERFLPDFPTRSQRALNRALERRGLLAADAVTAATRPIADDLNARLGLRVEHVPNAWDPDLDPASVAAAVHATDGRVELVHTGKLSGDWGRDPLPLLAGLRRLLEEEPALDGRVRLTLAGKLDEYDAQLIAEAGLGRVVSHVGQLSRGDAVRLQRRADALVLVTSHHSGEATGKLFEYLAAGAPIIALAINNEAARIVAETGTGVAVDPSDPNAIVTALRAAVEGRLPYAPRNLGAFRYPKPAMQIAELAELACARREPADAPVGG